MKPLEYYFKPYLKQYKVSSYLTYIRAKTFLIFSIGLVIFLVPEYIISLLTNSNLFNGSADGLKILSNTIYHLIFFIGFGFVPLMIKRGKFKLAANLVILISMINLIWGTLSTFNNDLKDSAMPLIVIVALAALLSNRILTSLTALITISYDAFIQLVLVPMKALNPSEIPTIESKINHFLIFIPSVILIAFILNLILKIIFRAIEIAEQKNIDMIASLEKAKINSQKIDTLCDQIRMKCNKDNQSSGETKEISQLAKQIRQLSSN